MTELSPRINFDFLFCLLLPPLSLVFSVFEIQHSSRLSDFILRPVGYRKGEIVAATRLRREYY